VLVEEPVRPCEPPARLGRLAAVEQAEREPEGAPGRPCYLAVPEVAVVGTLPRLRGDAVLTDEVGGDRELFEV
jgi:hypothetical protein